MDEQHCYDDQLSSIDGWLCKISGDLEEIKKILESNNNPIGITQLHKQVYKNLNKGTETVAVRYDAVTSTEVRK